MKKVAKKVIRRKAARKVAKRVMPEREIQREIPEIAIGASVFIRTVTHYYTGRIDWRFSLPHGDFLRLREAAWIADTARFSAAMATGELAEIEPYPGDGIVIVSLGSVIDISPWPWPLPRAIK